MDKKDFKFNNERFSFSQKIKKQILTEISNGMKAKDAFEKYFKEDISKYSNDKKYISTKKPSQLREGFLVFLFLISILFNEFFCL